MELDYKVKTLLSAVLKERADKIAHILEKKGLNDSTLRTLFEDYLGYKYFHLDQIGSTQDFAKELIRNKRINYAIVRADMQLSGRGRFNRQWYSPKGGLWFSILEYNPPRPELISFELPLAVVISLRALYGINAKIKWPNDITLNERKVSGILIESITYGKEIYVISGIGINCNNDPPIHAATSLREVLKREINLEELFLMILLLYIRFQKLKNPVNLFKAYCNTLGKRVLIVTTEKEEIMGTLRDIDSQGFATIELSNGIKIFIHSSQVIRVIVFKNFT